MPEYTVHYFQARGRGELLRLIFAAAEVEFVDKRYTRDEWLAVKESFPTKQMPAVEVDGVKYPQSLACARFLANRFRLSGKNDSERFQNDAAVDSVNDLWMKVMGFKFMLPEGELREKAQKEFSEKDGPERFAVLESLVKGNGHFVGDTVNIRGFQLSPNKAPDLILQINESHQLFSGLFRIAASVYEVVPGSFTQLGWADIALYDTIFMFEKMQLLPGIIDKHPKLKAINDAVAANPGIAAWVKKRPETDF